MKAKILFAALCFAALFTSCGTTSKTELFNGKDLTGWVCVVDENSAVPASEVYGVKEGNIKNGIIDLMIEYDNYVDIIDYKLKNISDSDYDKQLLGYKNYIEHLTKKRVNIYLYSLFDSVYREIK